MKLDLPEDVLGKLPAPDSQGLVRATIGLRINPETGKADLVELNDEPLPSGGDDDEEEEKEYDDANPMPADSLPDLTNLEF